MAKIVHFEVPVDDPDRAVAFYAGVLGWEINRYAEAPYWLVTAGADDEPGANGALTVRDESHPYPVLIAGVDDLDKTLQRVDEHGGVLVQPKMPVPGVGWSAYVKDSEGNLVGLFQPDPAPGGDQKN